MRPCMKRRLFYASSQAYQPRMETIGRTVGWLEAPIIVRREEPLGHRAIDVALVGRVPEGVVVSFRGTLAPFFGASTSGEDGWSVLLDWFNDSLSVCVEDPAYPGGVHLGFSDSMRRLWADEGDTLGVRNAIELLLDQSLLDKRAGRHLFVTGHSKGGALANLAAFRGSQEDAWQDLPISVATFAAARAGNADFAKAYTASRIACLRYELPNDLVPHLPPGPQTPGWVAGVVHRLAPRLVRADYHPVGALVTVPPVRGGYKPWTGSRRPLLPSLLGRRGLGAMLGELMPSVLAAHAICPDSGYDRLVCRGEADCDHGLAPKHFPLRAAGRDRRSA